MFLVCRSLMLKHIMIKQVVVILAHRDCGHIFKRFDEIFFINSTGTCFFTCEDRKRTIHCTCSLTALQHVYSISYWLSALSFFFKTKNSLIPASSMVTFFISLLPFESKLKIYMFVDKTNHLKTSSLYLGNSDQQFWPFSDILWTQKLIDSPRNISGRKSRVSPEAFGVVAELGLLTELTTVLLPPGGALDDDEEEDRPPSTESSSSKFLSGTTEAEKG